MTTELLFLAASFVVGIAMIVDGFYLLRHSGRPSRTQIYFSAFETVWAVLCVYLLITARLGGARWLAVMYIVQLPLSVAIALAANPKVFEQYPDDLRAPKSSAYFAGAFGGLYALAALFAIARA